MKLKKLIILTILIIFQLTSSYAYERGIIRIIDNTGNNIGFYKESHALVIGVSDYSSGWPNLPGVKKDVKEIKQILEKHHFNVRIMENPNKFEMQKSIDTFISEYGREFDNRLILFYSGHGYTMKLKWGGDMGYIIPSDTPNPHINPDGFLDKAIDMEQIEVYSKRIQSKHVLFLFDSCFSGTIFSLSKAIPAIINYKTSRPVRQFITAGGAEEEVPDKSVFCKQFVEALNGNGDLDKDGYITGSELGQFLQTTVINYSHESQHPQYGKIRNPKLDKGDFVFQIPDGIIQNQNNLSAPSENLTINKEEEFWKIIRDSKKVIDFEEYIKEYPNGHFTILVPERKRVF